MNTRLLSVTHVGCSDGTAIQTWNLGSDHETGAKGGFMKIHVLNWLKMLGMSIPICVVSYVMGLGAFRLLESLRLADGWWAVVILYGLAFVCYHLLMWTMGHCVCEMKFVPISICIVLNPVSIIIYYMMYVALIFTIVPFIFP